MPDAPRPTLIIITGLPGTGKTTLGWRLADDLRLPFIHKDGIKELLFDTLGWSDREWSKKLGLASYALLEYFIEVQLRGGVSFIVESNFHPILSTEMFRRLQARYDFDPVQILCYAGGNILFQRFKARASTDERHPGHVEPANFDEFRDVILSGKLAPLDIGSNVIEVDTTDCGNVDYEGIVRRIGKYLHD